MKDVIRLVDVFVFRWLSLKFLRSNIAPNITW